MKKISALIIALGLLPFLAGAQMQALFGYSSFYLPQEDRPYVETYVQVDAWTVGFEKQPSGVFRATVEVGLVVKNADSVVYAKKYDLNSPTVGSLDELDFSFLDVQRFSLKNGVYSLELSLRDKASDAPPSVVTDRVVISYDGIHPTLSSLQTIAETKPTVGEGNILSRGGYDMEPYVSDFYPEQVETLSFYYEVYNIDREIGHKPFLTTAFIERSETGMRLDGMQTLSRKNSAKKVSVFGSMDIHELPSGNYNLVVEVRNRENQLMLFQKLPFFRSNPGVKVKEVSDFALTFAGRYTSEDELNVYLDALTVLASESEKIAIQRLIRTRGVEEKQGFLYNFWTVRNRLNPEADWLAYKEKVDYVQQHFSYSHTPGIHTDMGRVYLQYGPPDFIRDEKNYVSANRIGANAIQPYNQMQLGENGGAETGMYGTSQGHVHYLPYQLWRYNKLQTDLPNRVFLFWDEHRSGIYALMNSNALGEVQESGWERRLSRNQLPEGVKGEVGEQFDRGY